MAAPDIIRGTYVTILVGDAAVPEVFAVLCGIVTKSLTEAVDTTDTLNRDCADPEEVPFRQISATGHRWSLRGSGNMNRTQKTLLDSLVGKVKNYRFFIGRKVGEVSPKPNGYYGGAAMVTTKTINGDDAGYVGIDLAIESDGPWTWVDVP